MSDKLLGAQDQGDEASQFNAADFHIQQALAQISTATLVKIVKAPYDKDGNTITPGSVVPVGYVDVQPMVNQIDGRGKPTPHGTIYKLSYHRYQGGRNAIISDPAKGDIGKMVVASRDTSAVRATNDAANPGSRRRFDLADGTFFGSTQQKEAPEQYLTFKGDGIVIRSKQNWTITFNDDGIKIDAKNWRITFSNGGIKIEARGNTITMEDNGVEINGALINKDGNLITKKGVNVDDHTHNQGNDSHGDAEVPTNPPNVG